ncbi:MAG: hypothetical protein ACHP79_02605 [Terriglobales bacterium]
MVRRSAIREFGVKITAAQREYYRYTNVSAEVQQRGLRGPSRPDFSRLRSIEQQEEHRSDAKLEVTKG